MPVDPTAGERHGISAAGSVALEQSGIPLRTGLTLAVQEGGFVRLEAETPDGTVVFAFVANDNYTLTLDFRERRAFPSPPFTLPAIGFADLTAPMLADLLLSKVPCEGTGEALAEDTVHYSMCAGGTLTAKYARRPVGHEGWFLSEITWLGEAGRTVHAVLRGHTTLGYARRIELAGNQGKATIALDEVDANPKHSPNLYEMKVPPGFVAAAR